MKLMPQAGGLPSSRRRLFRWAAGLTVAAAAAAALTCLWGLRPGAVPAFDEVRLKHAQSEGALLDRHGRLIHRLRVDADARRLEWVTLGEVSPALHAAVLHAEDRRFYQHGGIDLPSIAAAAFGMLRGSSHRGGSTLSMQVAAKILPGLEARGRQRSLAQKYAQIRAGLALERAWTKSQILEAYFNLVTYRGELQGIAAAAAGMFDKRPHGLTRAESLVLAALLRAPNATASEVTRRAQTLAAGLGWPVDGEGIGAAAGEAMTGPFAVRSEIALAHHVARKLLGPGSAAAASGERTATSTLDMDLQRYALETLRHQILQVRSRNVQDGALLVVDNGTGEVLAYAGNAGDVGSARYVDGTQALRQAGSTLKPFLYGLAFDRRLLTPVSMIDDSALDVPVPGGIYRPRNYDNFFRGLVTARTALASSLNVPAVKTLGLVGVESLVGALRDFGFRDLRPADYYGPSLALGSADVRLWDLAGAYRALANGGVYQPLRLTFGEVPGTRRQALSTAAAFLVSDVLSDREGRSATFSLESPLSTRFWAAVKTGTSKDMRDNWCVGYSDRYTVAVWVGNFSGEPMWDVSGVTGAAPVWLEIMNWLHRDRSSSAPVPPPGIESREVEIAGLGHNRLEWFLSGTETSLVKRAASPSAARIAYPAPGTVIALDPDIPAGSQRVFFEVEHAGPSQRWRLDGEDLGECRPLVLWVPQPGKHRLALLDGAGSLLDTVDFEVR